MKKEYTTPRMKVRKIQFSHMLCTSGVKNFGNINQGGRYDNPNYDYISGGDSKGKFFESDMPD